MDAELAYFHGQLQRAFDVPLAHAFVVSYDFMRQIEMAKTNKVRYSPNTKGKVGKKMKMPNTMTKKGKRPPKT